MIPLSITTRWTNCFLDARTVPIYDVFASAAWDRLWWIGPAYARKAFIGTAIRIDGQPAEFEIVPCRWHFTFQAVSPLPESKRRQDAIQVELWLHGQRACQLEVKMCETKPQGFLAAQTLARYDWPYVAEWIEHHKAMGVEHFFIYNNGELRLTRALEPYVADGIVTEIPWPYGYTVYPVDEWSPWWPADSHLYAQPPATMHCLRKYGSNWNWMWCGDCDEFLNPKVPLREALSDAGVSAWKLSGRWFGNAGRRTCPPSLREGYLRCERGMTSAAKLIVRPDPVECYEVHQAIIQGPTRDMPPDRLYFHHYRAASDHHARRGPEFDNEYTNEVEDRSILCPIASP